MRIGSLEKIKYNKPVLNVEEQIKLLKSRGLIIKNEQFAVKILNNITYYRLSAYMKFFQDKDEFNPDTSFEDIIYLYNFDKELKSLVFESIRLIEISIRTKICLVMCNKYGSHWFYNSDCYKSENYSNKTLTILENECSMKKDTFIKYYCEKYSEPKLPPFWMIAEVLSMGSLSKVLTNINRKDVKIIAKSISEEYYFAPVIENWIHVLASIRNICAHHSRLWNRELKIKLAKPEKIPEWKQAGIMSNKLSGVCFVISLLLKNHPCSNFDCELKELFEKYNKIDFSKMEFNKKKNAGWED